MILFKLKESKQKRYKMRGCMGLPGAGGGGLIDPLSGARYPSEYSTGG